jgi:hypothetical protein
MSLNSIISHGTFKTVCTMHCQFINSKLEENIENNENKQDGELSRPIARWAGIATR